MITTMTNLLEIVLGIIICIIVSVLFLREFHETENVLNLPSNVYCMKNQRLIINLNEDCDVWKKGGRNIGCATPWFIKYHGEYGYPLIKCDKCLPKNPNKSVHVPQELYETLGGKYGKQ